LIRSYQKWKGTDYVPSLTHPALKWSVTDPLPLLPVVTDAPWQIIDKKKKKYDDSETAVEGKTTNIQPGFVAAKGSVPVKFGKKRNLKRLTIECKCQKIQGPDVTMIPLDLYDVMLCI